MILRSGKSQSGSQSGMPQKYSDLTQEQLIKLLQRRDNQLARKDEQLSQKDRQIAQKSGKKKRQTNLMEQIIEKARKKLDEQRQTDDKLKSEYRTQKKKFKESKMKKTIELVKQQIEKQKDSDEKLDTAFHVLEQKFKKPQVDSMKQTIDQAKKQIEDQDQINEKLEAEFRILEQKHEKSMTGRDIMYYPKIGVSLDAFRRDEASKVNNYQMKSSFADLFKNRIDQIPGDRILLSVQPFVTIQTGLTEENRTFGPFDIEVPELEGREEMYKLFMYVLLSNNFNLQSGQMISKIGAKVMTYNKQFLMQHHMLGVKLESHLLSKYGKIKRRGDNCCVPDFIWDQCKGKPGFKNYTYEKLVSEVWSFATITVTGQLERQL